MSKLKLPGKASDFLKFGVAAAGRGDLETVKAILSLKPHWISHVGSHGRTMLWEACHRGKLEMVKYLVKKKADINACGSYYTPYFVEISCYCIARFKKRHEVAEFLLTKKPIVDIHTAAFLGDCALVKKLLKSKPNLINAGHDQHLMADKTADGIDVYAAPADWATPLCYALRGGDIETVEFLISKKATVKGNEEALFNAADDNIDMFRLLLENGADPESLTEVIDDGSELFKLVASFGVKPASASVVNEEFVYLCRGDRGGNVEEMKRLLEVGANINYQDAKGKTALHRASKAGFIDSAQLLLERGASLTIQDKKGETALFEAVRSTIKDLDKQMKMIRLLIKSGADPQLRNKREESAFSLASSGKTKRMKDLVPLLRKRRRKK
jgi:ankyrin repeat protein